MDDGIGSNSPHTPEQEAQRIDNTPAVAMGDESASRKLPAEIADLAQITLPLMQVSLRNV